MASLSPDTAKSTTRTEICFLVLPLDIVNVVPPTKEPVTFTVCPTLQFEEVNVNVDVLVLAQEELLLVMVIV